jgi:hypothetical protein
LLGLLNNINIGDPTFPQHYAMFVKKLGYYEGLGKMFEGDFSNMCAKGFLLMAYVDVGQAEGIGCIRNRTHKMWFDKMRFR